jgi:hypothetical protein
LLTKDDHNCIKQQELYETYLAEIVFIQNKCIFCGKWVYFRLIKDDNSRHVFKNWDAAQRHMRDMGHCKMNPEAMDLVDEFYDYSEENLKFLQRKFDNLQIKLKNEIETNKSEEVIIEEDEWEDCDSEEEEEILEEKIGQENETKKEEEDEQYVLIRGYWHPLRDKIVTSKFIRDNLEINDKEEVVLPNGKILGNRKYAKYYKQNMVEIVRKKSEIIRALAYREMDSLNKTQGKSVAKYESVVKTLER